MLVGFNSVDYGSTGKVGDFVEEGRGFYST